MKRQLTRVTATLLLFLVGCRYFCANYECPAALSQCCYYTSSDAWTEVYVPVIEEKLPILEARVYPWWGEKVTPHLNKANAAYVSNVVPHLDKLKSNYRTVVAPKLRSLAIKVRDYFETTIFPQCYKAYHTVAFKIQLYYHVFIVPRAKHIKSVISLKTNDFLGKYPTIGKFSHALNSWFHSTLDFCRLKVNRIRKHYGKREEDMPILEEFEDREEDEEEGYEEDDEEDEDGVLHLTSTITTTITLAQDELASAVTDASREEEDSSLDVPLKDLVQNEYQAWSNTVERKANTALDAFTKEVHDYEIEQLESVSPLMSSLLQNISNTTQLHFQKINKAILDINCTMEIGENGEQLFFDRHGTQLKEYITRPLMRGLFTAANEELTAMSDDLRARLKEFVNTVNDHVDVIRNEHLEVYEEWGDVMISEWSKRMAYVDVVALDEQDDSEQHSNWKNFLKLKRNVIKTRDLLVEHPVKFHDLEVFLKEVQFTLRMLAKESGEYLYILRSKANLTFQERERQEREKEKREEEERQRQTEKMLAQEVTIDEEESDLGTEEVPEIVKPTSETEESAEILEPTNEVDETPSPAESKEEVQEATQAMDPTQATEMATPSPQLNNEKAEEQNLRDEEA